MMILNSTSVFKMIKSCILVILLTVSSANSNVTSTCGQNEISSFYLDVAMDMITKAKNNIPHSKNCTKISPKPVDCADILKMGHSKNGAYEIWPMNRVIEGKSFKVYCDMETDNGGWTVIQRRGDFNTPKDYFYRNWKNYTQGFGNIEEDFWLGNDKIFALTNQKLNSVRFDLKDIEQSKRYAYYDNFWIADEDHNYTLHISGYSGDAGDAMANHNNQPFSTFDKGDKNICASKGKGGWWYSNCSHSNLNGLYYKEQRASNTYDTIHWSTWKGYKESLKWTEIKIRPQQFSATFS